MSTAVIDCERLVKVYRIGSTDVPALNGLDLSVADGEMVGIIGPSGCGKSTLLNLVGALDRPTSGTVNVYGADVGAMSVAAADRFRRRTVGFVWQDTIRNLIPYLDATDNITLALDMRGALPRRHRRHRADQLLELVGMADRRQHRPREMSGGQQQRVAVAVALASDPPLLLADEPTGALDGETAAEVSALLRAVNDELGTTIVIVSHDPNVSSVVDRVVELRDGQSAQEHRGEIDAAARRAVLLVDRVGRIRLPDEFREQLQLGERVVAELHHGEIVLRRPDDDRQERR